MAKRKSSKMRVGSCKCLRSGVKLCKLKNGKVKFKGRCRK